MASTFPGAIDSFTDPLSNSPLNSPSHSAQHADLNDAAEKIETYALNLPIGIVARADSSTDYTLTTVATIATGMSVTFTAIANRFYKITYMEPQVQTATVLGADTNTQIRVTSAAGTLLNQGFVRTDQSGQSTGTLTLVSTSTFSAGSVTIVGCAKTTSTSGAPVLGRGAVSAGNALLLVEDIGKL